MPRLNRARLLCHIGLVIDCIRVRGKRILVVEDEPNVRAIIKAYLCLDQHIVTEAADGKEACLLYAPGDYDLVLTDYNMPGMKGDELAETIKGLVPSQRILMLTGAPEMVWNCDDLFEAILIKPVAVEELRQAVAMVLSPDFHHLPPRTKGTRSLGNPQQLHLDLSGAGDGER
jgi:CheY-like chemotaxis protein